MKDVVCFNYFFNDPDKNDAPFELSAPTTGRQGVARNFKKWIETRYHAEVHTWDMAKKFGNRLKAAIYFDYSWQYARKDNFLKDIPFEKRALFLIEPANVNPSLYYIPFYRNRFKTVFTWDEKLLEKKKTYIPVNVPTGAEPERYANNPFMDKTYALKKLLVAVSRNRWSYMPTSTYKKRVAAYRYFSKAFKDQFDLWGQGWFCDNDLNYRGEIKGDFADKVNVISNYRFSICFENNVSQPGYISEKILDCFCARCVPVYYGSKGIEKRIPSECYIDFRQFKDFKSLEQYLTRMTEEEYNRYISAIDRFMISEERKYFSTDHIYQTIADSLGLKRIV